MSDVLERSIPDFPCDCGSLVSFYQTNMTLLPPFWTKLNNNFPDGPWRIFVYRGNYRNPGELSLEFRSGHMILTAYLSGLTPPTARFLVKKRCSCYFHFCDWRCVLMAIKKKASSIEPAKNLTPEEIKSMFGVKLKSVGEHLTSVCYPETGEPRRTTSFSLFCDDGVLKCFINDRDNQLSTCVTATTWQGLWEAVERALDAETTVWRPMNQGTFQKANRGPQKRS